MLWYIKSTRLGSNSSSLPHFINDFIFIHNFYKYINFTYSYKQFYLCIVSLSVKLSQLDLLHRGGLSIWLLGRLVCCQPYQICCLPYRTQLLLLSPPLLVIHYAPAGAASVVSDSVWPHRWQPTKLPHPWDSPSKNTGVGCHCLLPYASGGGGGGRGVVVVGINLSKC